MQNAEKLSLTILGHSRLRGDARGRHGSIRQELARVVLRSEGRSAFGGKPENITSEAEAHDRDRSTGILLSSNVKTAHWRRGILAFTHLAREGRMTVTIGRRELLAALSGAAAAWPLAARAQQPAMPVVGLLDIRSPEAMTDRLRAFRQGLKDAGFVEG